MFSRIGTCDLQGNILPPRLWFADSFPKPDLNGGVTAATHTEELDLRAAPAQSSYIIQIESCYCEGVLRRIYVMALGSRSLEDNNWSSMIAIPPLASSGRFHDLIFTVLGICALESAGRIMNRPTPIKFLVATTHRVCCEQMGAELCNSAHIRGAT